MHHKYENTWHYKLINSYTTPRTNLCPYIWQILLAPAVYTMFLVVLIIFVVFCSWPIVASCIVLSQQVVNFEFELILFAAWGFMWGGFVLSIYKEYIYKFTRNWDPVLRIDKSSEQKPSLIKDYWHAFHEKICPDLRIP